MEIKRNKSTDLRPEGDRVIDAPAVCIGIAELIQQLKEEVTWQNSDRNAMTIFKTNGFRIVLIALHEGAFMEEHVAEGMISVQVLEGSIKFSTKKVAKVLKKDDLIVLHKGLIHSVKAVKESVFLLTLTTSLEE